MGKTGHYVDEYGTKVGILDYSEADIKITEIINSSKTIAELKRQNDLYEKEIKGSKCREKWTLIIAGISAVISAISLLYQIFGN